MQREQGAGADGAGHVEVEADRLVHVALAAGVLADAGELVDPVRAFLVVRVGVQRQPRCGDRAAEVLLFFVVERAVDRVDRGRGAGDLGGAHVRRDRHQPAIAQAVDAHLRRQFAPGRAVVATGAEVLAVLPVAADEGAVAALFLGQRHARLDGQVVDALVQAVRIVLGLGRVPLDLLQGKQVMPAERAQADRAVLAVGDGRLRHRQLVEVDHVVQHPHLDRHQALQHVAGQQVRGGRDRAAQVDRGQVAHHEIAGLFGRHDLVAADHLLDHAGGAHVLQDLRAQIAGVDAAGMLVRVHPVHFIPVEHEGIAGLQLADHDPLEQVDGLDRPPADPLVGHHLLVLLAEAALAALLIVEVLQVPTLDPLHLIRIEQIPVTAPLDRLHEQVRQAHRGEHIVRAQALVAVVQAQIEEGLDVAVPDIQVHRDRALALAQLIHAHCGVVELLDPRHHAAGGVRHASDRRAGGAHIPQIGAHATAVLGDARHVGVGVVDALQAVVHRIDEARRQLAAHLAGIGQRRRRHRHVQVGQRPVRLAHQQHAPPP